MGGKTAIMSGTSISPFTEYQRYLAEKHAMARGLPARSTPPSRAPAPAPRLSPVTPAGDGLDPARRTDLEQHYDADPETGYSTHLASPAEIARTTATQAAFRVAMATASLMAAGRLDELTPARLMHGIGQRFIPPKGRRKSDGYDPAAYPYATGLDGTPLPAPRVGPVWRSSRRG